MKYSIVVAAAFAAMSLGAADNGVGQAVAALYRGKTAVITGAASGMGLCTSKTLAAAGANVVMCDINAEGVTKAADEINALGAGRAYAVVADVRKYEDAERSPLLSAPRQYALGQTHKHMREAAHVCKLPYQPAFLPIVDDFYAGMHVTLLATVLSMLLGLFMPRR